MHILTVIGGVIGLLLFVPLCISILKKESVQNPLTFFLWSTLDAISFGATYMEGGNYLQALLFAVGGLATVSCIFYAGGKPKWTWFETFVTVLAGICIVIWFFTSNIVAATATICALVIASVPQVVDTWKNPKGTPTLIYLGYTLSNALAVMGGKEFSIIEVGYALFGVVICGTVAFLSIWNNIKPSSEFWTEVDRWSRDRGYW